MTLVTRCPKCQSGFEVTSDQLRIHEGLVRCGQCSHVFDGYSHLQAQLPTLTRKVDDPAPDQKSAPIPIPHEDEPPLRALKRTPILANTPQEPILRVEPNEAPAAVWRKAPESSRSGREPIFTNPAHVRTDGTDKTETEPPPIRVMGEARIRVGDPSSVGRREPDFLEEEDDEPPSWGTKLVWYGAATILSLLLLVQSVIYFRNDLVTMMPSTRGVLEQLCTPFDCEVNYVRRIDRVVIIGSSLQQVSSGEGQAQSYLLRLTLQNRNDYQQHWPSLLLSLSDASGTVVVRKVISPEQYLPESMGNEPFEARREVSLEIPAKVSGLSISGFEIERFFP